MCIRDRPLVENAVRHAMPSEGKLTIRVEGVRQGDDVIAVSYTHLDVYKRQAIVFREWIPASHYLLSIGLSLIVGSALRFLRIEPGLSLIHI